MLTPYLRIALLHLAPVSGNLIHNRQLLETGVTTASRLGATCILTPELCVCGYGFADQIGTEWILPQPDPWMRGFCRLAARMQVTVFLSHPERDHESGKLHNSVFVIGTEGTILGRHRKINTHQGGSESWSHPGEQVAPIPVPPFGGVGVLICSDAYSPRVAGSLKVQGAQLLVSSAAWAPGYHGPSGEWEQRTRETGLPLLVCNRTGSDRTIDFTGSESVIVKDGKRLISFCSERSAIFTIDWNLETKDVATGKYQRTHL